MLGGWLLYIWQLLGHGGAPPAPPADPCPVLAVGVAFVPVATSRVVGVPLVGARGLGATVARSEVAPLPIVKVRGVCPC